MTPYLIHCSLTGRPIGQLSEEDSIMMEASLGSIDSEERQDEIFMRIAAFARPAPAFAVTTESSLLRMRAAPNGFPMVWAYLVHRWIDSPDQRVDFEARLLQMRRRIDAWPMLVTSLTAIDSMSPADSEARDEIFQSLLAIDSLVGLTTQTAPNWVSRLLLPGESSEGLAQLKKLVADHLSQIIKSLSARGTPKTTDAPNRIVAPLLRKHFWETRQSEASSKPKAIRKLTPKTANLLSDIMSELSSNQTITKPAPATPTAVHVAPAPAKPVFAPVRFRKFGK